MSAMMTPAIARVFLTLLAPPGAASGGPPPPFVSIPPGIVADLFIVVAMVNDWRTRGRPHRVYAIGLPVVLAQQVLDGGVRGNADVDGDRDGVRAVGGMKTRHRRCGASR